MDVFGRSFRNSSDPISYFNNSTFWSSSSSDDGDWKVPVMAAGITFGVLCILVVPMYFYYKRHTNMKDYQEQGEEFNTSDLLNYTPFKHPHPTRAEGNRDSVTSWGSDRDMLSFASVVDSQDCGCIGRSNKL